MEILECHYGIGTSWESDIWKTTKILYKSSDIQMGICRGSSHIMRLGTAISSNSNSR